MLAAPAHSYHTSEDLSPAILSDCHQALVINRSMAGSGVNKMEKEKAVFCTLIGREHHSVATPGSYVIKNQLVESKVPYTLLLSGSLWHKG